MRGSDTRSFASTGVKTAPDVAEVGVVSQHKRQDVTRIGALTAQRAESTKSPIGVLRAEVRVSRRDNRVNRSTRGGKHCEY
jgi:hypothetical protein